MTALGVVAQGAPGITAGRRRSSPRGGEKNDLLYLGHILGRLQSNVNTRDEYAEAEGAEFRTSKLAGGRGNRSSAKFIPRVIDEVSANPSTPFADERLAQCAPTDLEAANCLLAAPQVNNIWRRRCLSAARLM